MEITDEQMACAEAAAQVVRAGGYATAVRYDAATARLVVHLHTGIELAVPVRLMQGLRDADPADLAEIEITPGGLGLHWPRLDEDVYVPGLRTGVYGTKRWMATLVKAETARLDKTDRKEA